MDQFRNTLHTNFVKKFNQNSLNNFLQYYGKAVATLCILLGMMYPQHSYAYFQNDTSITVTGTVTDSKGIPLPSVNILEKNTTNGVQTDFDGKYTIKVTSQESVLTYTFIGMKTANVLIGDETLINVQMADDSEALDAVVLVGYGKQRRISVVGAQSTINTDELKLPVANISTALAGRVAGLTGVQRDGLPGFDGADLFIRGISSFGNARPLVLVDGVERPLDNIDPQDIASFTVLKDASATAVYGVRGANGVILIETRRGKIGKPVVTFDYYEGYYLFHSSSLISVGWS